MPDPAPAQGGAPAQSGTVTTPAPVQVVVNAKETDAFILRLTSRYGSTDNALRHLAGEQLRYRKRAQVAEKTATELQAKLPAAGAVVLMGDDATAFAALKKLGVPLDKIPAELDSLKQLRSKDSTSTRESALTTAAGEKYKLKVLKKLLGDIPLEFKTVNVKGKDKDGKDTIEETKVAYVVLGEGTTQTREALDTYLEREHADFLDVLMADDAEKPDPTSTETTTTAGTVTVPRQTSTAGRKTDVAKDDATKIVDKTLGSRYLSPGQRAKVEAAAGGGGKT